MSLKRKMHRQKVAKAASKSLKAFWENIPDEVKMRETARLIVTKNSWRIWTYCQTYYLPMFAWTMYKHFGFGFRRLAKLDKEMNYMFDLIGESMHKGSPEFYKFEWAREGLELEARFKYEKHKAEKPEKLDTTEAFIEWFAQCGSADIFADLEGVWLWVLYAHFGFGAKRLAKCREYMAMYSEMTKAEFLAKLDEIEQKCQWKHGDDIDGMTFRAIRRQLTKLGIEDGIMSLPLKMGGVA